MSARVPTAPRSIPFDGWVAWVAAILGPALLTLALIGLGHQQQRDYVFLYLGLVAVLGVFGGLWPTLLAAGISFLCVDYFFVPPFGTLTIADQQDIVNLLAFLATAGLVGMLGSRRRRALFQAEALAQQLEAVNAQLVRLNKEQAQAAQSELRLARSEQQIKTLQEADRLRQELLANVSHELRTPLGTILTESTAGTPNRHMATIASEARRLKALVDDMLDMAGIEAGALRLELEPVRLGDAIAASVERLQRGSPKRKVGWDAKEADVEVLADWQRLGQIFDNLLANADRYSPAAAPISVAVAKDGPGLVEVKVSDRGPGIPPELHGRLFERFVRGEDEAGLPGTGLGLAIVKGLVEAHAGTVTLEEQAGKGGATFRFTLPVAPVS
jgi:K+-sensing histidine kinase KdpD